MLGNWVGGVLWCSCAFRCTKGLGDSWHLQKTGEVELRIQSLRKQGKKYSRPRINIGKAS
jgi:hypothetical protein